MLRRIWLPVILFLATVRGTFLAGTGVVWVVLSGQFPEAWWPVIADGLMYSGAVMTILLCHEMGHFLQARRYRVYASLPYFIPMPFTPIGTFGAVIGMQSRQGDRKAIFDIGISGPLAGLVPTLLFLWLGLHWSHYRPADPNEFVYGAPLLVKFMRSGFWANSRGPLHRLSFRGFRRLGRLVDHLGEPDAHRPVGRRARPVRDVSQEGQCGLRGVVGGGDLGLHGVRLTSWWVMLGLISIMGTRHPPTSDDSVPLGAGRYVLGILTLAFLFLGFTPWPIHLGP